MRMAQVYFVLVLFISLCSENVDGELAILDLRSASGEALGRTCLSYDPRVHSLPSVHQQQTYRPVLNISGQQLCSTNPLQQYNNSIILADMSGNCSFDSKISNISGAGIDVDVVFVSNISLRPYLSRLNHTEFPVSFTYAYPKYNLTKAQGIEFGIDEGFLFNYSLIIIWLMANFVVVVGAMWSSSIRYRRWIQENSSGVVSVNQVASSLHFSSSMSCVWAMVSISFIVGFLLLAYFFPSVMYYVIVFMFLVGSVSSAYTCCVAAVEHCCAPNFRARLFSVKSGSVYLHQLLCLAVCASVGVAWLALINSNPAGWLLQNLLGLAFTVCIVRSCCLPSLFFITCLLVGLFVYDVFFVFITPLLTADGQSIMVQVATGGGKFVMPMVFKVPPFVFSAYPECHSDHFSLLGFGDVVVPGFLAAYCATYDRISSGGRPHVYLVTCASGYALGMVVTFVALFTMQSAQPALLYLVPLTLFPVAAVAALRGDLRAMWRGDIRVSVDTPTVNSDDDSPSYSALEQ